MDWIKAFTEAQAAAEDRKFDEADAVLADFIKRRKGTAEAREATYWRAVFLLDPKNRAAKSREAALYLEEYLAEPPPPANAIQARALRAMTSTVDSLDLAVRTAQQQQTREPLEPSRPAPDTAREHELEKEIERLKEQLDKANAELDRIKKRLTAPRPPG
ncbi:MAG: hypothetical protein H7Z74_05065 [Anaerolineae bacterium]|nr:hypothetical protein [Gemmatimonadaceae bacterium]